LIIITIIGTDQELVKSCKTPNNTGPIAARMYPTDWAIPDNCEVCFVSVDRKATNDKDKLRQPPIPKPKRADHSIAKKPPNIKIPIKPDKVIITMKIITRYCFLI